MFIHHSLRRAQGAIALFALLGGCSGPIFSEWSDPLYQRLVSPSKVASASNNSVQKLTTEGMAQTDTTALVDVNTLALEDAIRIALMNHPTLRRAAYEVRVAAALEVQSRLYPNPAFSIDAESLGSDSGRGGETTYLLGQEFVTAGKLKKAKAVAEANRLIAQASFRETMFNVATRVRQSFVSTLAAEQRLVSENELFTLATELLAAADAQVEAGAATEPDRLRAEVVREQAAIDLRAAEAVATASRRGLATVIGLDGPLDADLRGELAALPELPAQDEMLARVLDNNTRVEQAQFAIERARRAHELARAQAIPNLVASAGPRFSDPNSETTLDMGIGIEIPLFNRNQGGIAAAMAERIVAGALLASIRLELIDAVSTARSSYEASQYAVERYQASLLPKAERTLELTREAYRAGKTDYLRLLDAQQTYVRSRIAYVDSLESLHQAAAIIEGLMQTDTPWLNISGAISEDSQ